MKNTEKIEALKQIALDASRDRADRDLAIAEIRYFLEDGRKAEKLAASAAMEEINAQHFQSVSAKTLAEVKTVDGAIYALKFKTQKHNLSQVSQAEYNDFLDSPLPVEILCGVADQWADAHSYGLRQNRILSYLPFEGVQ